MLEFFLGYLTSLVTIAIIKYRGRQIRLKKISFRQSMVHQIVKNTMPSNAEFKQMKETQSSAHRNQNVIKVVKTPDQKAYWVDGNIFYCAEVIDGQFDPNAGKPVDTNSLSKKEVNELLFILDNINKGK